MAKYIAESSGYTDNSPFVRILRTEGRVRVLAALLGNPERSLSVTDLVKKTGMARSTVLDALDPLKDMGLVVKSDRVGNADLFEVNTNRDSLKHLRNAQVALTLEDESRTNAPDPARYNTERSEGAIGEDIASASLEQIRCVEKDIRDEEPSRAEESSANEEIENQSKEMLGESFGNTPLTSVESAERIRYPLRS